MGYKESRAAPLNGIVLESCNAESHVIGPDTWECAILCDTHVRNRMRLEIGQGS
jgi:hypothetical protein